MTYTIKQISESIARVNESKLPDGFAEKLKSGIVEFTYMKITRDANGNRIGTEERKAKGTQNLDLVPQALVPEMKAALQSDRAVYMIPYFDIDKNGIRQFHISRFVGEDNFMKTNSKLDVQKISANKFLYTNKELAGASSVVISPETAKGIVHSLASYEAAAKDTSSTTVKLQFKVQNSIPTLYYNVSLDGKLDSFEKDDIPFKVQEVRQQIFADHGVKIEKVVVSMDISFS